MQVEGREVAATAVAHEAPRGVEVASRDDEREVTEPGGGVAEDRGSVVAGETVTGETWVEGGPKGARFDRHVRFVGDDGRVKLDAVTTWALLDRASGRLLRVRPEIAAPFFGAAD